MDYRTAILDLLIKFDKNINSIGIMKRSDVAKFNGYYLTVTDKFVTDIFYDITQDHFSALTLLHRIKDSVYGDINFYNDLSEEQKTTLRLLV